MFAALQRDPSNQYTALLTAAPFLAAGNGGDILEKGIRGALNRAPDNISNPKGAPYTEKAAEAIQGAFK